jgi:hypothetical protein
MYKAIQAGVPLERCVVGAGLTLREFADLCQERPAIPAAIVRARLELEVELHEALIAASKDGKHMAAKALIERLDQPDRELADLLVKAEAGEDGELTAEQVEEQLAGFFADS